MTHQAEPNPAGEEMPNLETSVVVFCLVSYKTGFADHSLAEHLFLKGGEREDKGISPPMTRLPLFPGLGFPMKGVVQSPHLRIAFL